MKKGVKKQMAAVALSLLTVSGIGLSGANVVKAASPLKNKATINIEAYLNHKKDYTFLIYCCFYFENKKHQMLF